MPYRQHNFYTYPNISNYCKPGYNHIKSYKDISNNKPIKSIPLPTINQIITDKLKELEETNQIEVKFD